MDNNNNQQPIQQPAEQSVQQPVYVQAPVYTQAPAAETPAKGLAVTALILGIVSLVFGLLIGYLWIPAIIGIFFGIAAIILASVAKKKGNKSGVATGGLTLGIIGLIFSLIFTLACSGVACLGYSMASEMEGMTEDEMNAYLEQLEDELDSLESGDYDWE